MSANDPVLTRLRHDLDAAFGDRIERVVLYGSRARGDAQADSDYDVAVFLRGYAGHWEESRPLVRIETRLIDDTGALVHAIPLPAGAWTQRTPLMGAVRRDGIDL
jgi:uncharacterized protein